MAMHITLDDLNDRLARNAPEADDSPFTNAWHLPTRQFKVIRSFLLSSFWTYWLCLAWAALTFFFSIPENVTESRDQVGSQHTKNQN